MNENVNISRNDTILNPAHIMQLSTAYWDSQTLLTANRIGLFELLAKGEMSVDAIAGALNTATRQTLLFLKACVSLDLLEENNGMFHNSALSDAYLVSGKPAFLGNAIRYSDNLYETWGKLEQVLKDGIPPMAPETYLGDNEQVTRHFVYGMHNRAMGIGSTLVEMVDLTGRNQMLDVGGGPGTYSALLTKKFSGLHSQVLELPGVAEVAKEILTSMDAINRVEMLSGDYIHTPFPENNDVVLISGVFHRETESTCNNLIERAVASLLSGGMLIINDVFTDEKGSAPSFAALFGLNMMLTAPDGGVHSDASVKSWMEKVGLIDCEISHFPPPMPHRLVIGTKR